MEFLQRFGFMLAQDPPVGGRQPAFVRQPPVGRHQRAELGRAVVGAERTGPRQRIVSHGVGQAEPGAAGQRRGIERIVFAKPHVLGIAEAPITQKPPPHERFEKAQFALAAMQTRQVSTYETFESQ